LKKLKILDIVFENKIEEFEIESFRGAISRLVGFENTMFHNHISKNKLSYSYPLIQYKTRKGCASFTCISQGVEEASQFFEKKDWSFSMTGRKIQLKVDTFQLRNAYYDVAADLYIYTLKKWQPLNQENFRKFNQLNSIEEKIAFLEAILIGNILSMGKSIDWMIENKIKLSIDEIINQKMIRFKKNQVITFDLKFATNALLPVQIGLGKGVSHGYGIIEKREELKPN
jgi:hypothetical protein